MRKRREFGSIEHDPRSSELSSVVVRSKRQARRSAVVKFWPIHEIFRCVRGSEIKIDHSVLLRGQTSGETKCRDKERLGWFRDDCAQRGGSTADRHGRSSRRKQPQF